MLENIRYVGGLLCDALCSHHGSAAVTGFPTLWVRKAHIPRCTEKQGEPGGKDALLSSKDEVRPFLHLGRIKKMPRFPYEMPEAFPGEFPFQRDTSVDAHQSAVPSK